MDMTVEAHTIFNRARVLKNVQENKESENAAAKILVQKNDGSEEAVANGLKSGEMKLKVTAQDLKFLRSLKISVEDLDQQ